MSDSGAPHQHFHHVDDFRDHEDAGLIYQAGCGDWHWRCYLCEPILRSDHLATMDEAAASFYAHQVEAHHP